MWATIAEPKYVPINTAIAIINTFQLNFFNFSILFPTEIPAKAKIGVVVPKKLTSFVYFKNRSAVGIKGILKIKAVNDAQANAGNCSLGKLSLIVSAKKEIKITNTIPGRAGKIGIP